MFHGLQLALCYVPVSKTEVLGRIGRGIDRFSVKNIYETQIEKFRCTHTHDGIGVRNANGRLAAVKSRNASHEAKIRSVDGAQETAGKALI